MIRVTVTGTEEIRAMFRRLNDVAQGDSLARTVVDAERMIERDADKHTKTGALFRSVYSKKTGATSYEVGHDLQIAPHALFVHWGTNPHIIKPKNKKALRWPSGGAFAFAKQVSHPGNKPDKWLERAADQIPRIFMAHVETLLRKV